MNAREAFLQMTDPTNWDAGDRLKPGWREAMEYLHEMVMDFWEELEQTESPAPPVDVPRLLTLLKTARQHSAGMKIDAYDALQQAINELEPNQPNDHSR